MSSLGSTLAAVGVAAALTLAGGSFAFASTSQSFTGSGYGPSEASALSQAESHARMQGYGSGYQLCNKTGQSATRNGGGYYLATVTVQCF
jgi:hypothetical protein